MQLSFVRLSTYTFYVTYNLLDKIQKRNKEVATKCKKEWGLFKRALQQKQIMVFSVKIIIS